MCGWFLKPALSEDYLSLSLQKVEFSGCSGWPRIARKYTLQMIVFQNPQSVGSIPKYILYSISCSLDSQIWLWSQVTSLFWSFGRVKFFATFSTRMHQLCSFFNMTRISSSAKSGTKGVYFCSAVLEKLASKLALGFSPRSGWHQTTPHFKLWICYFWWQN